MITIFGGFLFHMLWEAKGRYILPYFVMMLPMAAVGLSMLAVRVKAWADRRLRRRTFLESTRNRQEKE